MSQSLRHYSHQREHVSETDCFHCRKAQIESDHRPGGLLTQSVACSSGPLKPGLQLQCVWDSPSVVSGPERRAGTWGAWRRRAAGRICWWTLLPPDRRERACRGRYTPRVSQPAESEKNNMSDNTLEISLSTSVTSTSNFLFFFFCGVKFTSEVTENMSFTSYHRQHTQLWTEGICSNDYVMVDCFSELID